MWRQRRARSNHSGTPRCKAESNGLLGRAADCTLPPPMRLVLGGDGVGRTGEACEIAAHARGRRGARRVPAGSRTRAWHSRARFSLDRCRGAVRNQWQPLG